MTQSKEFSSEAQRTYYMVAKKQAKINAQNFAKLQELQPSKENSVEIRNIIGKSLLNTLKQNDFPALTQRQKKAFIETPYEFEPKIHPQSPQYQIVENYKEIMMVVNEFYVGHYPVSLELQKFLVTRNNKLFSKNEKIVSDGKEWVESFKEHVDKIKKQIVSDIPITRFSVSKLRIIKKTNPNLLVRMISSLSIALDEVQSFFGEKIVEKADDLVVLFEKSKAEPIEIARENPLQLTESEKKKEESTKDEFEDDEDEEEEEDSDEEPPFE